MIPDDPQPVRPVATPPDSLDAGLLAVARHFMVTLAQPANQSWHSALTIATERWGAERGPQIAMALFALLQALERARPAPLRHCDPLCLAQRARITPEEAALLALLRAMARDLTAEARRQVAALTGGRLDPGVIRAGLAVARLLPRSTQPVLHSRHRGLALVH